MDFTAIILFLVIYYVRPQEWIGLFASLKPVKLTMVFAAYAMLVKNKGLSPRDFFKTPHDWLMALYIGWVIYAAESHMGAFTEFMKYIGFYWIIVIVLHDMERIQRFLNWWTVMILVVAALGVSSLYFWDPMGAKDLTENTFEGRLVLTTSIFNNPNALGHGVVPVVPMLYFLFLWKRPIFIKEVALVILILPLYCLYQTFSKGAYLSGGATLMAGLLFGRPKIVQIALVVIALTGGITIVKSLPRMDELNRGEGGIQGRLAAWEWGLEKMQNQPYGIGWKQFVPLFNREMQFNKAAHSSYVQTGAELGFKGLFLFIGVLYGSLRTVMTVKTKNIEEERIRRMLFCLVCSYAMSSWVIDFGARSTFFMIPAAIGAFQRQILKRHERDVSEATKALEEFESGGGEATDPNLNNTSGYTARIARREREKKLKELKTAVNAPKPINWNRLGVVDFVLIYLGTKYVVSFWTAVLEGKYI